MTGESFRRNEAHSFQELIDLITTDEFDQFNFHWLQSGIPEKCTEEPCILGVDEAGRGPVLGPMVYSVFYCSKSDASVLSELGCADSKALTEKKREEIFQLITSRNDQIGWAVDVISPNKISNDMLRRAKHSLNEIAETSTIALIESILKKNIKIKEIYVDTIGPPDKYQNKLSRLFPDIKVIVEKKADSIYPVVGAASICAKVIRDAVVQHWKFPESITFDDTDFGSGYPGDPKSKKFLADSKDDIFGFPNFVRFSWSTAGKLLENCTTVEWDDENEENTSDSQQISSYFKPMTNGSKHKTQSKFFKERALNNLEMF